MGPLISAEHRDKVLSYYELAREEGAEVITGGGVPELGDPYDGGFYIEPTIWTGLPESARCVREEIFGPVCHIQPFDEEDEVVAMANDTDYGLAAAIWTQDVSRAHRVARRVEAGPGLGQRLVSARSAHPVRRGQAQRPGPRGRDLVAELLLRAQEHLRQAMRDTGR